MKNILVTGGAGYVGAVLVPKLLNHGFNVSVIDWFIFGDVLPKHPKLKKIKGDLRNFKLVKKSLKNIDAIIHLACISNDPSFDLNPDLGKSINFDATINIVDMAKKQGVRRFIYASSSSVYGIKKEANVTEDLSLSPLTDYSKYKALCEEYLLKQFAKNFVVLILRPATVCGYSPRLRLDLTVNILTLSALSKNKITVYGGSQKRPNIHIEDMTDLYVQTLKLPDTKINGKIYNAGYENYSLLEIAQMVKKIVNNPKLEIEIVPTDDLRSYRVSSEKIKRELNYIPKHTIEQAISDLKFHYDQGYIKDPKDIKYYNIATMKKYKKENFL